MTTNQQHQAAASESERSDEERQAIEHGEDLSIAELARLSGLTEADLHALAGYGAIAPRESMPNGAQWMFSSRTTIAVRAAGRLRDDLGLDLYAVSVCLRYLDRIERLERRIRLLQAQLPGSPGA